MKESRFLARKHAAVTEGSALGVLPNNRSWTFCKRPSKVRPQWLNCANGDSPLLQLEAEIH